MFVEDDDGGSAKLGPCKVFQNVCIIPKCLDPQRTVFQKSYFSVESQCATTMEYLNKTADCGFQHVAPGKRQKKVVGTVKKNSGTV